MNWILLLQLIVLAFVVAILVEVVWCAVLEKKADMAIRRWREGIRESPPQDR
jgi:hypothetical protein